MDLSVKIDMKYGSMVVVEIEGELEGLLFYPYSLSTSFSPSVS
jgi:hypothetical protein